MQHWHPPSAGRLKTLHSSDHIHNDDISRHKEYENQNAQSVALQVNSGPHLFTTVSFLLPTPPPPTTATTNTLLAGEHAHPDMTCEDKPRSQPPASEPVLVEPTPSASAPADVKIAHVYVVVVHNKSSKV